VSPADGFTTVWLDVDAADGPRLDAWYDSERLRQLTVLEGFVCTGRYRLDTGPHLFVPLKARPGRSTHRTLTDAEARA